MKGIEKTFLEPKLCCFDLWTLLYHQSDHSITSIIMILHIPTPLDTGKRKGFGILSVRRDKDRIIRNSRTLLFSYLTHFVVKKKEREILTYYLFFSSIDSMKKWSTIFSENSLWASYILYIWYLDIRLYIWVSSVLVPVFPLHI